MTVFSPILPRWQQTEEPWDISRIINPDPEDLPDYLLQKRDLEVLQLLLEHRFLTTNQIAELYFPTTHGKRAAQRRLKYMFEMGLVKRVRPIDDEPGSKPFVYALTLLGRDVLIRTERVTKEDVGSMFYYNEENQIEFNRIIHELHLNDVCLSILKEADQQGRSFEWLPTKLCRQTLKMPNGRNGVVEPDAVFIFYDKPRVLHIEYERSADPRRFHQKLERWKVYREQQIWQERYSVEPVICVIGDREGWETSGRKRRVVKSIKPLQQIAQQHGFPNIFFLPMDEIQNGTWNCLPQHGQTRTLWQNLDL